MKIKKQTAAEQTTEQTRLEHVHFNSAVIASQMRVLQFEAEELMKSEAMIGATLDATRSRRKTVEARIAGLKAVLASR